MDDDFDYDSGYYRKPRMQLASGSASADSDETEDEPSQAVKAMYCSFGVASLALGLCAAGVVQFFAFWFALAFVIGPFSPRKVTGGDCQVGQGGDIEFDESEEEQSLAVAPKKGSVPSSTKDRSGASAVATKTTDAGSKLAVTAKPAVESGKCDWKRAEWDQLRKLLVKLPRGTPQRWENVARGLGTKRSTEEVITASKFMTETNEKDPYAAFTAQVKAPDKGASNSASTPSVPTLNVSTQTGAWTDSQDKALLKALKECPKGDPQRWDKVAQGVPGRSKGECQKRLTELRDALRAKKSAEPAGLDVDEDAL